MTDAAELRRLAEERVKNQPADRRGPPSEVEIQRLLHELQVHQIELEMQNEELRESRAEVEGLLARYTDLFDFAPIGYFTLTRDGAILAVNLTGARLVGIERARLLNTRFMSLVAIADRPIFVAVLKNAFSGSAKEYCDVSLPREGMTPLFVHIEAVLSKNGQECRAVVLDITERHEIETQRNQLVKDLKGAVARVKVLSGLLPICAHCKKIRNNQGYWEQLEAYLSEHSDAVFNHGICPVCYEKVRQDFGA
jgi:PAS domain S-box-containing protein